MSSNDNILVIGLGNIGALVATMLYEAGFNVTAADSEPLSHPYANVITLDVKDASQLQEALAACDIVVSCLPYFLNGLVAEQAQRQQVHYLDLTEDVKHTERIIQLAKNADSLMIPQCGLAPGMIVILGMHLYHQCEVVDAMRLRVGALPDYPKGKLKYACNWSAYGLINEYNNPCIVIEDGTKKTIPPLKRLESVEVAGMKLEAFSTSGGLGTLCDSLEGKVNTLNYKTMRYPGHRYLMEFLLHDLDLGKDIDQAVRLLEPMMPPDPHDVVYVYVRVNGIKDGVSECLEYKRALRPILIANQEETAIAWTTASSVSAVVELIRAGYFPHAGFITQESIAFNAMLNTQSGHYWQEDH